MTEPSFEARLRAGLQLLADDVIRPIDPHEIAVGVAAGAARVGPADRLRAVVGHRWIWVAAAALALTLALAGAVAFVGRAPSPIAGDLLFIRGGDLYTATGDGSDPRLIAKGGAAAEWFRGGPRGYVAAEWSPDLKHILAVRDDGDDLLQPHVEILEPDGHPVASIDLPSGGVPALSWAPDGQQFAMQTFPSTSPKNSGAIEVAPFDVTIRGLDGQVRSSLRGPTGVDPKEFMLNPDGAMGAMQFLSWSPDGRWILFHGQKHGEGLAPGDPRAVPSTWLLPVDGSAPKPIDPAGGLAGGSTAWTGAGQLLAWIGCANDPCVPGLSSLEPDSGAWTKVPTPAALDGVCGTLVPAPAGDSLAVWRTGPEAPPTISTMVSVLGGGTDPSLTDVATNTTKIDFADVPRPGQDPGTWASSYPIQWSADGDQVRYLEIMPDTGGQALALQYVALTEGFHLMSAPATGGQPTELLSGITWFDTAGA